MIDRELLKILVCPENHSSLCAADADLINRLNAAIAAGRIRNRAVQVVSRPVQGGLVREDRTLLYPIIDDIPVLLVDEAIPLRQLEES